jgi:hypothetical protein
MMIRILSIDSATPDGRKANFGRYQLVIEADGKPHEFLYTIELPSAGGRSICWKPSHSFLSDDAVPVTVVMSISNTVEKFHRGESVQLPLTVTPEMFSPDTVLIRL